MRSNGIVDGSELDFEVVGLVLKMKGGILKYYWEVEVTGVRLLSLSKYYETSY